MVHIHIKSTLQLCGSYPYPYQKHFTTAWSISNPYQKHLTTVWSISISISKALYSVVLDAKPSHHCPEAWKVFVGFCAYRCITKLSFKVYIKQKLPKDAMSISQKYLNTTFASTTTPISEIHFTDWKSWSDLIRDRLEGAVKISPPKTEWFRIRCSQHKSNPLLPFLPMSGKVKCLSVFLKNPPPCTHTCVSDIGITIPKRPSQSRKRTSKTFFLLCSIAQHKNKKTFYSHTIVDCWLLCCWCMFLVRTQGCVRNLHSAN